MAKVLTLPPDFYDAELRRHNEHLRAAADVQPDDRVLDIGCGAGLTTRQAARVAVDGSVLGVDVSAPMLERARRLSAEEGLHNVSFEEADAQTHALAAAHFDLCLSRFGTMFFADPVAAFANIGQGLRPGARLILLVWQAAGRNEWATEIDRALDLGRPPAAPVAVPSAFSLADPAVTETVLTEAGFTEVGFADVHEPVFYGQDVEAADDAVRYLWQVEQLLTGVDAATREHVLGRLRATIAAHDTGDGVLFDSRAWLVTAVNAPNPTDDQEPPA